MGIDNVFYDNLIIRFLTGICIAFAMLFPAAGAGAGERHVLFEAVYDAKIKIAGGKVRLATTQNEAGEYTFEYTIEPGKLIRIFTDGELRETTKFEVHDGRPRALEYTLINTIGSKPRNGHVTFDWNDNTVQGNYKDKIIDMPIPENAVDRAMLQLILMADLRNDDLQEQYAIYDKDEFISISVERIGEESITVPVGTFSTVVLRHANSDGSRETILWCAEALGYLPVRIQSMDDGSKVLVAKLSSINGLPENRPDES